ncbi:MAG: flagellar motor protein MotB, partial [Candidatus Nanopelagicales bacterium]
AGGGRGRKRRVQHEEHVNHDRWLVTYADTITLLMVLFIVLFAISQVDKHKFEALAGGLASGFGKLISVTPGSDSVLPNGPRQAPILDMAPVMSMNAIPQLDFEVAHNLTGAGLTAKQAASLAASQDASVLDHAQQLIDSALRKSRLRDHVELTRNAQGLHITVIVNDLVFPADRADLQPAGRRLLAAIAPALREARHNIVVEGNTNTVAVRPRFYPSEWELSSARASSVVRYLVSPLNLDPQWLSVVGYGDTRPLVAPSEPGSATRNRRVAIVVLSSLSSAQRALLDSAT